MVISLPENMLGENRKEIRSIEVEGNFSWKKKGTNSAYGYFCGCNQSQLDIHRYEGQKQTKGHKPGRNRISVRLFHDIVSSTDREVNQDTGSKSTEQTA
jgi:hypothetical protein